MMTSENIFAHVLRTGNVETRSFKKPGKHRLLTYSGIMALNLNGLRVTELRDGVKVYDLTAGKAMPTFLTDKQKRRANKSDEFRGRVELIQDFHFPTASSCLSMSGAGDTGVKNDYIVAAGVYPPMVKIFDLENLSMKCESFVDAEIIRLCVLENSFRKLAILRQDRTIEFHAAYGKHYTVRIPKFGRDMLYEKHSCDLVISASSPDVYRLNLEQGQFLSPYVSQSPSVNRVAQSRSIGCLLGFAGEDGALELWDNRTKAYSSRIQITSDELTALQFSPDGLHVLTGTSKGECNLHDLRMVKPLHTREHPYEMPIHTAVFHASGNVLSADPKMVKIWDRRSGKILANIETSVDCDTTELCLASDSSGVVFLSGEKSKVSSYYIPKLGPAPEWCSFLDNLTEELEETNNGIGPGGKSTWEDYKFVTKGELEDLNLGHLIGTNLLRGYMHGYFMDSRLHTRVKAVAAPEKFEEWRKEQILKRVEKKRGQRINVRKILPKVNKELALRNLSNEKTLDGDDDRFKDLFTNSDFQIDEESEEFKLSNPSGISAKEKLLREKAGLMRVPSSKRIDVNWSSDGDGAAQSDEDDEVFGNVKYKISQKRKYEDEEGEQTNADLTRTKVLSYAPVHNVELVPGSQMNVKKKRELQIVRMKSSLAERLVGEEEKLIKAIETRRSQTLEKGGYYSVTYNIDRAQQRR